MATQPPDGFDDANAEAARATALLHDLAQLTGAGCVACSRRICGHEALFSVVMGLKNAPRCLTCLAAGLSRSAPELRDQMADHIQHRDCFRQAWEAASEQEGLQRSQHPVCLWPAGTAVASDPPRTAGPATEEQPPEERPAVFWDAGQMSCGDLVLALRLRLDKLSPGDVLQVTARDPAAPQDLPAWCRLTGHRLLQTAHPRYLIQRKEP